MSASRQLKVLLNREEIAGGVARLAKEISRDYQDRCPLLVGVLKGSFVFMADLIRALEVPVEIDFVALSSYGSGTETTGRIKQVKRLSQPIKGKDVLVVEDIVDTGLTVRFFMDLLLKKKPSSLKLCALFDKPSRRVTACDIDYVGFTIPDKFVVGYGLDCDQKYRHLPDLCVLEE